MLQLQSGMQTCLWVQPMNDCLNGCFIFYDAPVH